MVEAHQGLDQGRAQIQIHPGDFAARGLVLAREEVKDQHHLGQTDLVVGQT